MSEPTMRINESDLFDPKVEGYLEEQAVLSRATPDIPQQSLMARIFYSSYFYLGLAGGLGAIAGWGLLEPWFEDGAIGNHTNAAHILMFPTVAGGIGLLLGSAEGLVSRN